METYICKIQCDMSGQKILIYSENRDVLLKVEGDEAKRIKDGYGLEALTKTFVQGEVDQHGLLHLGNELEDQGW